MRIKRIIALLLVVTLSIQLLPINVFSVEQSSESTGSIQEAAEGRPGTTVLGELSDRRTESEKHFRMDDGSYIAVDYGMPIHFTEDNGTTWEDIDNTLTLSEGTAGSRGQSVRGSSLDSIYTTNNGDSARNFAYNLRTGFLFSTQTGTHNLRMSLTDAAAENDQANFRKNGTINDAEKVTASDKTSDNDSADDANTYFNPSSFAEISYPDSKEACRGSNKSNYRLTSGESSGSDLSISEQVMPAKLRTDILYRDVYDNVDLHYELCSYNIKETILVNQPRDSYSFTFYFDSGDLTPVLMEDGSCVLQDEESEVVYLIPAPYMTDSAGEYSEAVTYSLEETDSGSWALTVTADEAWMNDPSRVFPVSIDPTLYDAVHPSDILKRCVASGGDPENYIHKQNLVCGYHPTYGQTEVYFKISQLPTIPAGSEAISAIFSFYQNDYRPQTSNSIVLSVRPCLSGISNYNSLTWNGRPSLGPVLDYNNSSYNTIGKWLSWDVTSEAKKWYANASSNYGLAMTSDATSSNQRRAWFTYSTVFFYVTYRDMTGIEPYYTYQTLGADRAGAAYISDYTGALTTVTPLVSYASTINPFSLNLVYNSSYFKGEGPDNVTVPLDLGYGMRMGSGMKLDLLQKVEYVDLQDELESSGTKRYIKYTDSDGTAHYFAKDTQKDSSGKWYFDEDGLGLKITEYAANYFRMEDDNGNKWYFVYGFLTIIQDANGNSINLWFKHSDGTMATNGYPYGTGNTLDHITLKNNGADAITVATFAYNTDDGANTLHSVTDAAGNVYSFVYSCHKLRSILRNSSAYVDYIHPYNNKTNRFVNPVVGLKDCISEYSLSFTYADSKISSYFEKGGNTQGAGANITRVSGERTTYTDWGNDRSFGNIDDISTTYLFDYAGRTVNAFSTDVNGAILGASNAIHSGTGNTDKKNNRTLRSAGIGLAGVSMIRNGSFELSGSGMDWTIVKPEGSSCAATIKTGELVRTGTHAFKTWVSSSATGPTGGKKLIGILTAGQTYTASVYVNTSAATGLGNKGVYLRILDSYGGYKTGEYLNYKTDTAIDGGWVKLTFSFTPERSVNHYICVYDEGVRGEVYYDDLQVEAGSSPSNVNLLDNGGISSSAAGWLTESNAVAGTASVAAIQGNNAIQITGNPKTDKYVHQTVALNQPGTQTYVLSGWAKANAVPDNQNPVKENNETDEHYRERVAMDTNKQYGLRAILTYDDTNHTKEYHYVSFNADVTDWQFASLAIVPKQPTKTVASIQVVCAYEKNANTAFFDNLSLVKEVAQTMKYDKNGNLVSVQSTGNKQETSTYNNGNLTQVKAGGDGTFDYSYDNKHNVTEATNSTVKEKYTYDGMGNMLSTTLSKAEGTPEVSETVKSGKTYTNSGNLVLTDKSTNGCYTTFTYGTDASKMFGSATKVTNPVGTETVTNYLNDGRISSAWINSYVAINRTYNSKNLLTKLNRGGYNKVPGDTGKYNQYYNFTYDAFGNTTGISVGKTSTYNLGTYTYAPQNGLLMGMTYGNGATVRYTYDDYGRKIQTDTSSHDQYKYAYSGDGQLYEMKDVSGSLLYRYAYDTLGRMIGSSLKSGSAVTLQTYHQYDDTNRLRKQVWSLPGKTYQENYEYDANNGRLTMKGIKLSTSETANITLNYDNLSRVSTVFTPAATTNYSYCGAFYGGGSTGLISELTTTSVHTGSSVIAPLHLSYTYDALGNIRTEKKVNPSGSIAETLSYTYDNQSQLTKAVSSVNGTWNYQYDTYGNIRHRDHGSDTINYTYSDTNWLDLLTAVSGTKNGISFSGAYSYDGAGNPTSFYNVGDLSTWTMTWKNGRELATASNGTHSVSYDYDVNSLRTYKIADGIRHDYIYASGQLLRETYTQGGTAYTLDYLYDQNGRPYMLYLTKTNSSGTTSVPYYYILNLQGDVICLVNTSGVAVASYSYDSYGNILTSSGPMANVNPIRYRGYYYDQESGFYYLQSRYYDPALGRLINADTYSCTGQGFLGYNMFAYCCNRVVSTSDQTGEFFLTAIAIGLGVGLAAQYIGDVVENVQSGETGVDVLVPHSSIRDYAGSGIGCAIAAIPGCGFLGTVALGAVGNLTSDFIKGNLKERKDVVNSALKGGLANAVGFVFQKGMEFLKVKQISNMPRTERKLFLKTKVYQNSQAFVNSNLRTFANATVGQNMKIVSKALTVFKSGIYSTLVSGIFGKLIE